MASTFSIILYNNLNQYGIWRILFLIGGIASLPFIFLRQMIPESPRWLLNKGRIADADDIVRKIEVRVENNLICLSEKK